MVKFLTLDNLSFSLKLAVDWTDGGYHIFPPK